MVAGALAGVVVQIDKRAETHVEKGYVGQSVVLVEYYTRSNGHQVNYHEPKI